MLHPEIHGSPKRHIDATKKLRFFTENWPKSSKHKLAIIGNGPSAATYADWLAAKIEQDPSIAIFRMNWFFLEKEYPFGRTVDGYFWTLSNEELETKLCEEIANQRYQIRHLFSPMRNRLEHTCSHIEQSDFWLILAQNSAIAEFMQSRPLPTTGLQVLATALILGFEQISIIGLDFYESSRLRYCHSVPMGIASRLPKKDTTPGYEEDHSREVDFAFLRLLLELFPEARIDLKSASTEFAKVVATHGAQKPFPSELREGYNLSEQRALMSRPRPSGSPAKELRVMFAREDGALTLRPQTSNLTNFHERQSFILNVLHLQDLMQSKKVDILEIDGLTAGHVKIASNVLMPQCPEDNDAKYCCLPENRAYVTFTTQAYLHGTRVLARSLGKTTCTKLIIMVCDPSLKSAFSDLKNVDVRLVPEIKNPNFSSKRKRFQQVYTKLNCFGLVDFERLIFLDSDMVVLKSLEHLFLLEEFSACPDWGEVLSLNRFNSGLFVFTPSNEIYTDMMEKIKLIDSYDGGDQGFLNDYFSGWKCLHPSYNMLRRFAILFPYALPLGEIRVVHLVGKKPWEVGYIRPEERRYEDWWLSFLDAAELETVLKSKKLNTITSIMSLLQSLREEYLVNTLRTLRLSIMHNTEDFFDSPFEYLQNIPRKVKTLSRILIGHS
jgi:alpha-N-acetylglucosamine transferase